MNIRHIGNSRLEVGNSKSDFQFRISNFEFPIRFLTILFVLCCCAGTAWAQQPDLNNVEVHVLPVQGNIYMLVGAGANITVQIGNDGVLVVDTEYAPLSGK